MRFIVLSVAIGLSAVSYAEQPSSRALQAGGAGGRTPDLRGTEQAPFFVKPIVPIDVRGTAQAPLNVNPLTIAKTTEEQKYELHKAWYDFILTLGTVILAIFTFALWLATRKLAEDGQRALAASEAAVNAAQKSAEAAERTATTMEKTAERQLRAYLSAWPHYVLNLSASSSATVSYEITNNGQTPAIDVVTYGLIDICPHPLPSGYALPQLIKEPAIFVLHPQKPKTGVTRASRIFAQAEIANAITGTNYRVYIFVRLEYSDVFGQRRTTTLCTFVDSLPSLASLAGGSPGESLGWYFAFADQHNTIS